MSDFNPYCHPDGCMEKIKALELQNEELKGRLAARENDTVVMRLQIDDMLQQKEEMANHAARLRVCLLRYGNHFDRCAVFPQPSWKDCDCGFEANVQAVPGEVVVKPNTLCAVLSPSNRECIFQSGHDGLHSSKDTAWPNDELHNLNVKPKQEGA